MRAVGLGCVQKRRTELEAIRGVWCAKRPSGIKVAMGDSHTRAHTGERVVRGAPIFLHAPLSDLPIASF